MVQEVKREKLVQLALEIKAMDPVDRLVMACTCIREGKLRHAEMLIKITLDEIALIRFKEENA